MKSNYSAAYAKFNAASKAAAKFTDKNWNEAAITRERVRLLAAARAELLAVVPALAEGEAPDAQATRAALAQLAPHDANTIAVTSNEWAKVKALLDSGRNFAHLIDNADRNRLAAILDRLPTEIATQTDQPDDTIREVENRVLARLAEIGDEKAKAAQAATTTAQHEAAWRKVIDEATKGRPSIGALSALHRTSPEDYRAVADDDDVERPEVNRTIDHLDQIASTLAPEAANDSAS